MKQPTPTTAEQASLIERDSTLLAAGEWSVRYIDQLDRQLLQWQPEARSLTLDTSTISRIDTAGAWLLKRTLNALADSGYQIDLSQIATEHSALLELIGRQQPTVEPPKLGLLERIGRRAARHLYIDTCLLQFIGKNGLLLGRTLLNPSRLRLRALLATIKSVGFDALPIIGLLSFLTGVVLAYQGAVQLQRFGANIFIVDLVSLSLVRELSPLLTAIIVAGRSGSAFTAQIGTMRVTDEVDALRTMGIAPLELLVLPKVLALMIALPLLTLFADILGIIGGMLMAYIELGVSTTTFIDRLGETMTLNSLLTGLGKAPVFAAIIAIIGCFQGFRVRGSAESVGHHTTLSVVQSIFLVIVADAIFSVIFSWLKI